MKDFFKSYHTQKVRTYMRSSVIALALAFPIAGLIHQSSPQGMILANVLEAGSTEVVEYSADFLVKQEGSTLSFILGKDAYDVDTLSFSLLGDPERFLSLQSNDPSVSIVSNEPGVALVKITKNRSALKKGEVITTVNATLSGEAIITTVDPILTSMGQSYSLSVKTE